MVRCSSKVGFLHSMVDIMNAGLEMTMITYVFLVDWETLLWIEN